jgi:hypothetical protein
MQHFVTAYMVFGDVIRIINTYITSQGLFPGGTHWNGILEHFCSLINKYV